MPILTGSCSVTRFNVTSAPAERIEFDDEAFREIQPGSEIRESIGFVPFEPGAEYEIGARRWAFRVRIDRLVPDATLVRERLRDLVELEKQASGADFVKARKRRELKHLAQEEALRDARPRSSIVEAVIDGGVLTVGSTADNVLGKIALLLRKVDVLAEIKTPWIDHGDPELESEALELRNPFHSLHGSRFVQSLVENDLGESELPLEPVDGYVKLQTRKARVTLAGQVLPDLHRYLDEGCEVLAAKFATAERSFRLDALAFRISSLSLDRGAGGHWTEVLDDRLTQIGEVWELLDSKYAAYRRRPGKRRILNAPATDGDSDRGGHGGRVVAFDRS